LKYFIVDKTRQKHLRENLNLGFTLILPEGYVLFSASPELVIHLSQLGIFLYEMEETRTEHRDVSNLHRNSAELRQRPLLKTTKKKMISK
jgi:hypothetical protein